MPQTPHFLVHSTKDNVGVVVVEGLTAGTKMTGVVTENDTTTSLTARQAIPIGHKVALKDIKKGEMEVEQHDDYTTIQLKFSGKEERIRVPTPWLSSIGRDDDKREYQVVVQRVDVDDVRVLGPCGR